jgi:nucleotide-binding universal stress UspA family protein
VENILLPIDLAHPEKTEEILKEAIKYKEGREVSFTLVHIVPHIPGFVAAELPENFAQRSLDDVQTQLEALVKDHGLDPSTEVLVRSGNPQREIVSLAKEKAIDLIIIASHQPVAADYLLGSVAAAVVRHASCSVLVKR